MSVQQTASTNRIEVLDVLRGVAILGTLGTNIWLFTDPDGPLGLFSPASEPGTAGNLLERTLLFLANGKFLSLLTIMFGIGLELQYASARRRGARWPGWYLWRTALLFAEGLAHYLLIFEFDVLMGYAIIALQVAFLVGRSERVLRGWLTGMAVLHVLLVAAATVALSTAPAVGTHTDLYTEGSWPQQVLNRVLNAAVFRLETVFIIPMGTALFLTGVLLLRAGVFHDDAAGRRIRSRLVVLGAVAFPVNLFTSFHGGPLFVLDRYLLPPLVALGLLGGISALVLRMSYPPGLLRHALSCVGRTALSCYVFQNLVASALCYGWGLGLAGSLADARPWWVIAAWFAISGLFMTLATWWLRGADRGPLESAMHWAYRAPQRQAVRR